MKVFGFVVMREKAFDRIVEGYENRIEKLEVALGAERWRVRHLQKDLADMSASLDVAREMVDGLWEMQDPTMKGEEE